MIAKRIDRKPEVRDNFGYLGRYVAAAREKGEKLDKFWIKNCDAGAQLQDLDLALIEIEATRQAKPEIADKTYHLVVSFRAGDQARLSEADLQDIERNFAEALGYGDHQRVAGTHINTDNFHMHVAINKIHPVTARSHTPRQDFKILAKVAREMEQKYGLVVDKGMTDGAARDPVSAKARDYEAKTWQQSFERHLVEHKAEIVELVAKAGSWQKLQEGLAEYAVELRKRGAGAVFAQTDAKGRMKASALDRTCALAALEERLGPYQAPQPKPKDQVVKPPGKPYRAKPMTRHPAQARLWRTYAQQKKPGFLARNLKVGNWKYILLADAHKDPLALCILLTHKELLHTIDELTTFGQPRQPRGYRPPSAARDALQAWYKAGTWKPPAATWMRRDLEEMDLRADESGRVLFPFRDQKGYIHGLRAMDVQGQTLDIGDLAKPGLSHVIDPGNDLGKADPYSGSVVITCDCMAAAVLHKDTGAPIVVVGTDAELASAAATLRDRQPKSRIVVVTTRQTRQGVRAAGLVGGQATVVDNEKAQAKIIADLVGMGRAVPVDLGQAKAMGAFTEDALSSAEALDSQPKRGPKRVDRGKGDGGLGR
ncbi:TraI/MobA(P) family conjugative relaxase [Magnetospirillum sp. 15-1]|uniref:TraI/MobA(P) family conjugative relaxase n=1 Tax=Magnetospirillum sp. 15-1 TaxID=1979370 RepID=UPI000BBB8168|nr:TraI/MobA(P) family conjugative relaxase [Magnetospirillum sp. 15-1]